MVSVGAGAGQGEDGALPPREGAAGGAISGMATIGVGVDGDTGEGAATGPAWTTVGVVVMSMSAMDSTAGALFAAAGGLALLTFGFLVGAWAGRAAGAAGDIFMPAMSPIDAAAAADASSNQAIRGKGAAANHGRRGCRDARISGPSG